MKKLTLGLVALLAGYAGNSFAALPIQATSPFNVSNSSACGGFTVGVTGLYWRPSASQLDYALTYPFIDPTTGFLFDHGRYHSVDHDYELGWKVNIGYVFPCSGNDIHLTYTSWNNDRLDQTDTFSFGFPTVGSPFFEFGVFPIIFPAFPADIAASGLFTGIPVFLTAGLDVPPSVFVVLPSDLIEVRARSKFQDSTWDLDFGHAVNIGCNFRLRWFGGVRYSSLKHSLEVEHDFAASGTAIVGAPLVVASIFGVDGLATLGIAVVPAFDVTATLRDVAHQKSDFNGVGPRLGFEASYHLGGGIGVVGSLATSLLIGEVESTFSERIETAASVALDFPATIIIDPFAPGALVAGVTGFDADPIVPITTVETIEFRHPDETRVVPNIDAKLGFDWSFQFCNHSRSLVTLEAGYMVSHYFNAVDRLSAVEAVAPELRSRKAIDLSFDGPYIGIQVTF